MSVSPREDSGLELLGPSPKNAVLQQPVEVATSIPSGPSPPTCGHPTSRPLWLRAQTANVLFSYPAYGPGVPVVY